MVNELKYNIQVIMYVAHFNVVYIIIIIHASVLFTAH